RLLLRAGQRERAFAALNRVATTGSDGEVAEALGMGAQAPEAPHPPAAPARRGRRLPTARDPVSQARDRWRRPLTTGLGRLPEGRHARGGAALGSPGGQRQPLVPPGRAVLARPRPRRVEEPDTGHGALRPVARRGAANLLR